MTDDVKVSKIVKRGVSGVAILLALYVFSPFTIVPTGYRGVVTTFGKPSETADGEGLHVIIPVAQSMNLVNVAIQNSTDKGEASSKDLQSISTTIALNYHVKPEYAMSVYRDLGNEPEKRIVQPSVQEAVKAVTAGYTAEELISKREIVRNNIIQNLEARLERHGLKIDEMSITNFSFSPSFNNAIEAKTTAEQLKLKADRDLERIKVEAEQRVAMAEGEAKALAAQKQQITPELLQLRSIENSKAAIDKWDGKMPEYMTTGSTLPFIGVNTK